MQSLNFKVGDKVVCINDSIGHHRLKVGTIGTIVSFHSGNHIRLDNDPCQYMIERFRLYKNDEFNKQLSSLIDTDGFVNES